MIIEYSDILKGKRILSLIIILLILCSGALHAQSDKRYIRQGNREYEKNKFSESEILYRKATDKNKNAPDAVFNTGDALYKQKKYEEAGKQFIENIKMNDDKTKKSEAMFNLGNSMLKASKLPESIEAYKGSLKLNPENMQAKYNLAYAQDMLRKQQEQKQQQGKDKNQNKDQNKKDQKNDKKDQKDQNKEQQKDDKQNQDKQQPQDQQQQISKDDAQRLLNALANEEKNVQEKVKLAKAAKEKVRSVKNW
jgi:Ca-activated chloride channel family protein